MANETYSVAALAAALNVPRTTINDWLAKYESFIEVAAVGKRKVYPERTLQVLQEVARLRDMGKSGAEIEAALEQSLGVTPEIASEKTLSEAPAKDPVPETAEVPAGENTTSQLPAIKKFEENAMELAAFIAELKKEQLQSKKRSRMTAFLLFLVIIILLAALGAAVQAVRMQFAERQLEAVRTRETLQKLNKEFTAELKSLEKLRQQERITAEKNASLLKNELVKLQKASAAEAERLTRQLADDRKAMQQKLAQQAKALKSKSDAERKALQKKLSDDALQAQTRFDAVQRELSAAKNALLKLNEKLEKIDAAKPQTLPPAASTEDVKAGKTTGKAVK